MESNLPDAPLVAAMLTGDDDAAPLVLDAALRSDSVPLLESVVQRWGPQVLDAPQQEQQSDPLCRPPMLAAAFYGAIKATEYMLARAAAQHGGHTGQAQPPSPSALVNARHPEGGITALFVAVWTSHAALVRLLLTRGAADATLRYGLPDGSSSSADDGVTVVMVAALRAHRPGGEETLRAVLEHCQAHHPSVLHAADATRGRSALHYAAEQAHDRAVWLLLQRGGCDPGARDAEGRTALDLSEEMGFLGCAHLLRLAMGEVTRCALLRRMRALSDCAVQAAAAATATAHASSMVPACLRARLRGCAPGGSAATAAVPPRLDIGGHRSERRRAGGMQRGQADVCTAVLQFAVRSQGGGEGGPVLPPDLFVELMGMMETTTGPPAHETRGRYT